MIKQKEIAKELDLSVMTVSKALRNHPDLSETTKARVIQKALEMGYTDIPALHKASKRPLGILAYSGPNDLTPLESEVRRRIFESIQQECNRNHIETVIEFVTPNEIPLSIRNHSVNGVFVLGRYTAEAVANLRGIPALAVSSFIATPLLPCISGDNQDGIRKVTEHLISLGHQDIVFFGTEEKDTELYRERSHGYTLEMLRHGLTPRLHFTESRTPSEWIAPLRDYTGIVCSSDYLAHSLINALVAQGKSVPKDFSIVGYDNLQHGNIDYLTTYAPDWKLLGEMAVQLLHSCGTQINGKNVKVTVPGKIVIRKSTTVPRSR